MKSSMNCRLYVPSRFTPGSQSPPLWPVSVPEPTYPVFTGPVTIRLPAQPPPPTPCVRPFHAPWTPPVPPSSELRGRPTRMLMFCSGDSPYITFTWQYDLFWPLAAMIVLVTVLMAGLPASPSAGFVASSLHVTGRPEGSADVSFAGTGEACNAAPSTIAVNHDRARVGVVFLHAMHVVATPWVIVVPPLCGWCGQSIRGRSEGSSCVSCRIRTFNLSDSGILAGRDGLSTRQRLLMRGGSTYTALRERSGCPDQGSPRGTWPAPEAGRGKGGPHRQQGVADRVGSADAQPADAEEGRGRVRPLDSGTPGAAGSRRER